MSSIEITKLRYPDTIRTRVGMYLGETANFTTPLREIINNSEDEMLNGYATKISIDNYPEYKMVVDNGRGIPCYEDPDHPGRVITHSVISDVHSGSKFTNDEVTSGLNGVGSSAVNAVSDRYVVVANLTKHNPTRLPEWVRAEMAGKSNPVLYIEYRRGLEHEEKVVDGLENINSDLGCTIFDDFSTAVYIVPDITIYDSAVARVEELPLKIIRDSVEGSEILLNGKPVEPFKYEVDVTESEDLFLDQSIPFRYVHNDKLTIEGVIGYSAEVMTYGHVSLVNLINNTQGGFIEQNICKSIGDALHSMNSVVKRGDAKLGLLLYSVTFTKYEMSFSSQTKERLVSLGTKKSEEEFLDASKLVSDMTRYFLKLFKKNSQYFDALLAKIVAYKSQMNKLSNIDFLKSKVILGDESDRRRSQSGTMSNVYEASSRKWAERELYIPEGLSASGGLLKCRNKVTQSVLPLRGKLINTSSFDESDLVNNAEILAIINTVGCGIGQITDVSKSRYGKIIIATDSDVDGSHISNLVLALFLLHAPELVKAGMVYKLDVPYYYVKTGKKIEYFYMEEKDKIDFDKSYVEKRKGLGSYTEEEVRKFMINPATRRLVQLKYSDEDESNVQEAIKLLYSSYARKRLMIERGVLSE